MTAQAIHEVVECYLTLMLCAEIDESERTRVSLSLECIQTSCSVACSTISIPIKKFGGGDVVPYRKRKDGRVVTAREIPSSVVYRAASATRLEVQVVPRPVVKSPVLASALAAHSWP
jgi:hypothetical protein